MAEKHFGAFHGRGIIQTRGSVGGSRSVFVMLKGQGKNELVYPTFGGVLMNPFRGKAKFFAGDLFEYRTNANGVKPEIYILKTFEVVNNNGTTINIKRDGYKHKPFAGDVLMVAPDVIGGTGTAVTVNSVTETKITVASASVDVWQVVVSATLGSLATGTVLVEAEEAGSNKAMLVKNINAVADCDGDMFYEPNTGSDDDYDGARYLYTPALGGLMYTSKMSPVPQCVKNLNACRVNGWFKLDAFNMSNEAASLAARVTALEKA